MSSAFEGTYELNIGGCRWVQNLMRRQMFRWFQVRGSKNRKAGCRHIIAIEARRTTILNSVISRASKPNFVDRSTLACQVFIDEKVWNFVGFRGYALILKKKQTNKTSEVIAWGSLHPCRSFPKSYGCLGNQKEGVLFSKLIQFKSKNIKNCRHNWLSIRKFINR